MGPEGYAPAVISVPQVCGGQQVGVPSALPLSPARSSRRAWGAALSPDTSQSARPRVPGKTGAQAGGLPRSSAWTGTRN